MDSMRSLDTSLPRTTPRRQVQSQSQSQSQPQQPHTQQQPEDLLSAFKQAALSVTTLYKSAASLQAPARAAGYQDAVEDLLTFLDKENLGLTDGEGWRVRQWATERFEGSPSARQDSDEEEEDSHEEERAESVPAESEQKESASTEDDLATSIELPPREQDREASMHTSDNQNKSWVPSQSAFTFRSPQILPTNHDRDVNMDAVPSASDNKTQPSESTPLLQTVKVESATTPRPPRHRQNRMANQRSNNSLRSLGSAAGSKRKFPLGDFFDLSGITFDSKDGPERGSKRGRHA
ncbi:hypothetical protein CAC42_3965 [Sphaceloma murrayae]|uniref:Uncharacterized protein n=1 Tax=Sphaceloma murrayae TaxID=2082308 RepID=A0A2K1QSD1_9PEZI|nr:hypothetical protein CAC42_3965 [Sphaceloma murrayae]